MHLPIMNSRTDAITLRAASASAKKQTSVIILLLLFAAAAVTIRVLSIHRQGRRWKIHDFASFLSLFTFFGYCLDLILAVFFGGYGLPVSEVHPSTLIIGLKCFFASEFLWSASITSFRVAIILLYIEIFPRRTFVIVATATAALVITWYVSAVIVILVECLPVNFNWDKSITGGHCLNGRAIEIYSACFNLAVDIWVVCMPMPIVWDLQMATKRKVAVSATFALGFTIAGLNIGRLVQNIVCDANNFTYCAFQSSLIVVGEMSVGIVVACVPTFGPVFFPKRSQNSSYDKNRQRSRAYNSKKTPGGISDITIDDEGPFHALEDDEIELNRVPHGGPKARIGRGSIKDGLDNEYQPNTIHVKRDLMVVESTNV